VLLSILRAALKNDGSTAEEGGVQPSVKHAQNDWALAPGTIFALSAESAKSMKTKLKAKSQKPKATTESIIFQIRHLISH